MEKKAEKESILIYVCYVGMFFLLFLEDVAIPIDISFFSKAIKMLILLFLIINIVYKEYGKYGLKELFDYKTILKMWRECDSKEFWVLFFMGCFVFLFTKDVFFIIIMLLGYNAVNISDKSIYRISLRCCVVGAIITVLLYIIGILPDILSYRTDFSVEARHSLGFMHSAILPLIICYIMCYYIETRELEKKNNRTAVSLILIAGIGVFFICGSRNALISLIILWIMVIALDNKKIGDKTENIIRKIGKMIIALSVLFAIIPPLLRSKGWLMPIWHIYDAFFTNRSLLGSAAVKAYGIHLINAMSYGEYSTVKVDIDGYTQNGLVLDSAYMYLLIRYGVLMLAIFCYILYSFYCTGKNNNYKNAVFIIIILMNMTDNDLLSYSCMPFLIIGIKNIINKSVRLSMNCEQE